MPTRKPPINVLAGATATGKTAVAEWLAARLGATIICADSRQVFRELSAGTGKPTPDELCALPHRLFDALSVTEQPTAGWYARAAAEAVRETHRSGGIPLLVGGSGLYLRALMHGLSAQPPRDPAVRSRLAAEASTLGAAVLHERLVRLDPERASQLESNDSQRVTRALEIVESSGRTTAWWQGQPAIAPLEADWSVAELTLPAALARERIDLRTMEIFDCGLIEETRILIEAGRESELGRLRAVGYDEAIGLLNGRMTRAEAEAQTAARTRRLAKRQRTWFRHQLDAVRIPVAGRPVAGIGAAVLAALEAPAATPKRPGG